MDKRGFMRELEYHLRSLTVSKRKDILQDYDDHFKIGEIDGKTEQEVILELGSPRLIAQDRLSEQQIARPTEAAESVDQVYKKRSNPVRSLFIAIVLLLFNAIIVAGPLIGVIGILVSFWAVAISFTLVPFAWIFSFFLQIATDVWAEFFVVLTLSSIGILIGLAMVVVTKVCYRLLKGYIKWNVRIIRG